MKKTGKIFICFCLVFVGILIGRPTSSSSDLDDKLKDFESEITDPNNDYNPNKGNATEKIDPNIANSVGKKGEQIINKVSDYMMKLLIGIFE